MPFEDMSIQRKLILIIMLMVSLAVVLARGIFFWSELVAYRRTTVQRLSTLGNVIATNSSAALAFDNEGDADDILSALKAEPYIALACLYDKSGKVFATYPADLPAAAFPATVGNQGYRFGGYSRLAGFQAVMQGDKRLGTLYLEFDGGAAMSSWLRFSLIFTFIVCALILLASYAVSRILQRKISGPILALAETAREVSERRDYSVRAEKQGGAELGLLTDSFNQMLGQIQELNRDLERRVIERTAQLEAANRELEAFSYSVSHDLRAPLRGVDGYVRMLKDEYADRLDAEGHRLLDVVSSEANRMGQLIDDLLAFSRLGRQQIESSAIDMTGLAQAVFESVTATGSSLAPVARFELKPLPAAHGDYAMLRQVFVNLIGNAVKYSGKQPQPVIEVDGWNRDGEVTYSVKDNGVGFDEKFRHKLFGIFQRLHSEEEFEGTGVGLAIVQRIVHRHGGKVQAEGKLGEGAVFSFTLPSENTPTP